jgi:hypothetical protein
MKRSVSALAVVVSLTVSACSTGGQVPDGPASGLDPDPAADAAVDAGHSEMTGEPVAPIEPIADDGAPDGTNGADKPTVRPLPTPRPLPSPPLSGPKVDPIQVTIFNRFLVKPKDQALPDGEIKRLVEEATGAKVTTIRRTAVGYWLVQLEPTTPPRTADDQQKVIGLLQAGGAFAVVERDQIMQIK